MSETLGALRRNKASHDEMAQALEREGGALEALPYTLTKEIDELALHFKYAQWAIDEDCLPDTDDLIVRTESLLSKLSALRFSH